MSISLQTNVDSLVAQQNLNTTSQFESKTIDQLTSGYRINSSADDAAGLAIANGFRSTEAELTQGVQNANNGVSTLQIVDGGMNNISQMLDTLRTLATQSASGTFTGNRGTLNNQFQSLLTEVDRESQSIGMNTGGQFAKSLSVYVGGGTTDTGTLSTSNGTVNVDLSNSAVDTQALGLKGMQVIGGSTDLSAASTTSVANIVGNASNTTAAGGFSEIDFAGPGFSDGSQVKVSVNLSGVTDMNTLVSAINSGIQTAGTGNSAAATAFANAGIVASVNTDSSGGQELAFTSSTTAFQVGAGDQMANALLGNFVSPTTSSAGKSIASTVTGAAITSAALAGTTTPADVAFQISGGGLTSPVTLNLGAGSTTTALAITDITSQVANNTALKAAGITVSQSAVANSPLVFTDSYGNKMNVQVTGDSMNQLGFGAFVAGATPNKADYSTITGSGYVSTAPLVGSAVLGFSIDNGDPTVSTGTAQTQITVDLAGGDATAGTSRSTQSIADALNSGFAASTTLSAAGLQATDVAGQLQITSSNGTSFRLSTVGSTTVTGNVGFGLTTGATAFAAPTVTTSKATFIDASGVSNTGALAFNPMQYGNDTQAITISANNASGSLESKTITLQNNATATTGQSIDSAVSYINQQLQLSNDPTLQSVAAVKEDVGGVEKINLISSLQNFSLSVGTSPNGDGFSSAAGSTVTSSLNGTAATVAIDTQAGAIQAVTAVASAVTKLGNAQAGVGEGENQLNYATGLAQSQITNFSAAESRIRDANVAAEAANLTKAQTLQQAGIAAMAQANTEPQAILALLHG